MQAPNLGGDPDVSQTEEVPDEEKQVEDEDLDDNEEELALKTMLSFIMFIASVLIAIGSSCTTIMTAR